MRSNSESLDPTDRLLRLIFRRAVTRVAWLAVAGTAACSRTAPAAEDRGTQQPDKDDDGDRPGDESPADEDPPGDGPPEDESFREIPCRDGSLYPVEEFELAGRVDYAAVRYHDTGDNYTESERGVPCESAQHPERCERDLSVLDLDQGAWCTPYCDSKWMITTKGDHADLWAGPDALREILGDIDTVSEALFWIENVEHEYLACGEVEYSAYRVTSRGVEVRTLETTNDCLPLERSHVIRLVEPDGTVSITSSTVVESQDDGCAVAGRKPAGLARGAAPRVGTALGRYLARAAHLEAASVTAFEVLARELEALGAPLALIRKVRAAALDEVDHAARMGSLARRFGAQPSPVQVCAQPPRGRFALALDNAVEGCVREAFGALLATYQAQHASDAELRGTLARIAEDETRHASLSLQLAMWLETDLTVEQRERLEGAKRKALESLRRELACEPSPELRSLAGMPSAQVALRLLAHVEHLQLVRRAA